MGSDTSHNESAHQGTSYERLQYVRTLAPSRSLMLDPLTNQQFVAVENTFPSEDQMVKFMADAQTKIMSSHQYYMSPIKHFMITSSNLCSKQHKFIQLYPFEDYSLQDEINNRKEQNRGFNDKQIWSILCSCVLAMSHLTRNDISHLTLHPKDIVLNASGQVKILSSEMSDFSFDYTFKNGYYYAPEILKVLKNQTPFPQAHCNKPAVFTLGMSILSVCTRKDFSFLYREDYSIDYATLNKYMEKVEGSQIKDVLVKMLKPAPYDRISFPELQEMLYNILEQNQSYSNDISNGPEIQKLEESIFRVKMNTQYEQLKVRGKDQGRHQNMLYLPRDDEDLPDSNRYHDVFQVDRQKLDQELQTVDKKHSMPQPDTKESSKITEHHEQDKLINQHNRASVDYHCSFGVLNDIGSRLLNRSQQSSFQVIENKKTLTFISEPKTSRQSGPYYVTEQYSRGRYEGYKQNGMRHGFGTFFYQEGGKFTGEWVQNKMEGRGALYYSNGQLAYEGEWRQDQLNGYGILYNEDPIYITSAVDWKNLDKITSCWVKYEGNFENDLKNGEGTLYLSNGEYFRGQFNHDLPNGAGTFRDVNGKMIGGVWLQGVFHPKRAC